MKLRPLHDRVIVKRLEQETKTASGIVIPDNAAEKPDQGEVVSVGPGKRNDRGDLVAMNIRAGDRVLFGKYSGQTVKVDGDELLAVAGAAGPAGNRYGDPAGHVCLAVSGRIERAQTLKTGVNDRLVNMHAFAAAALGLFAEALA